MKKSYQKPEMKKVSFSYEQAVVASGGPSYCDQGWTKSTTADPNAECDKCNNDQIWIGSANPFSF